MVCQVSNNFSYYWMVKKEKNIFATNLGKAEVSVKWEANKDCEDFGKITFNYLSKE